MEEVEEDAERKGKGGEGRGGRVSGILKVSQI